MTRPASPAEVRTGLAPDAVDALAGEVHNLLCRAILDRNPVHPEGSHEDADRAKARFLMLSLRDAGWHLTREPD